MRTTQKMNEETINKIKNEIKERINVYEIQKEMIENIISILKNFENKTINKRIETEIKKQYPGYTIYYSKGYTFFELKVWGNGLNYNDSFSLYLEKHNEYGAFSLERFLEYNEHLFHHEKNLVNLHKTLFTLKRYVDRYNALIDVVEKEKEFFKNVSYPASSYFNFDFTHIF